MKAYDLSKVSILVLEKHLLIRKLLTDVFEEFGVASVLSTADPKIAYDFFMTTPVDIVISDWTHDLDGMAFLKQLRQGLTSCNPFVPIIVCTAYTEFHYVCTARDMGTTEFLAKPVSAKTIYSRICALIEGHRPFIRTNKFFGPDRRRSRDEAFVDVERRMRPF